MIKVVTIVGARPQFIKAATVSRAIAAYNKSTRLENQIREVIVHTGQHYDENMSKVFFQELCIPEPDFNLGAGSGEHGEQTGRMLAGIEKVLLKETPHFVITYGDTNSTAAGALAAVKLHIPSGHVEAGLRSYNRRMPEEINRLVADELSNILFCPTVTAVSNLEKEGIVSNFDLGQGVIDLDHRLVMNAGDVMYDSILFNRALAQKKSAILHRLNLCSDVSENSSPQPLQKTAKPYCLATVHRAENTDRNDRLLSILDALRQIAGTGTDIVLPVHPRTRKRIAAAKIAWKNSNDTAKSGRLRVIDPVGYLDMVQLESHAKAILTDSGGVQKEAFLLKTPCITLRNETEWVETVQTGWNELTGSDTGKIAKAFSAASAWDGASTPFTKSPMMLACETDQSEHTESVYGDGNAANTIVRTIASLFSRA